MFSALILLLITILVIRGIFWLARSFVLWLGRGKTIRRLADGTIPSDIQYAEDIRAFVDACEGWRSSHSGLKRFAQGHPRLTRAQKRQVTRSVHAARNAYLDVMKLEWYQLVIIFLMGSVLGLLLEEVWMFITAGLTQSRVGLVWGPFSPLYGFGATFLTIICWHMRKRGATVWQVFLISVVVGGALEQITGWGMETLFDMSSWSYLHLPDHITQYIAWRFLFMWGALGLVWERFIMPDLLYRIGMATTKRQVIFVGLLALYLTADIAMTLVCFNRMQDRKLGIPPHNAFEAWVDTHYTDQFIAGRFQNMMFNQLGAPMDSITPPTDSATPLDSPTLPDPAQARLALVMGREKLVRLHQAHVVVLGVGGVGSNCIEALARGGVGALTILDRDVVEPSNINRQAVAWRSTIGRPKVEVMRELIADINPTCKVRCIHEFLPADKNYELLDSLLPADFVVDAIDTVTQKLLVARWALARGVRLISSMGGGNKLNPCHLKFGDISETSGDKLARIIRKECRKRGITKLEVLYSDEHTMPTHPDPTSAPGKGSTLGTMSYMPPIMGQMIAGRVILELAGLTNTHDPEALVL